MASRPFAVCFLALLVPLDFLKQLGQRFCRAALPVLEALLHRPRPLRQGDEEGIVAVLLRRSLDRLDEIDDLDRLPFLALFDRLDGGAIELHEFVALLDDRGADVLLHQLVGLPLERLVDVHLLCVGLSDHGVDRRQGRVVVDERPQERVRRDDLVEHLDFLVLLEELLAPLLVAEVLDQVVHVLVVEVLRDERQILRRLALHLGLEQLLEQPEVLDDRVDLVAVERQRLLQLVEDADEVEHEAVRLDHLLPLVLVGPVHPRDRLQQRVVAHRLVEIHRVEDRRVEAGQQLLGDDQDLRVFADLGEVLADLLLLLLVEVPLLQLRRVVVVAGVDDLRDTPAAGTRRAPPCRGRTPRGPRPPETPCSPAARRSRRSARPRTAPPCRPAPRP